MPLDCFCGLLDIVFLGLHMMVAFRLVNAFVFVVTSCSMSACRTHLGCVWIKDLVREKEKEMEMVEIQWFQTVGSSNFFIFILFSLTKSLIQIQS